MTRRGVALGLVLALVAAGPSPPAEPAGYRMRDYRAPTPPTLAGAEVLSTDQAQAIWEAKSAVFIDVLPQPPRPPGLPPDTIWHPRPRHDIPGSIWLPDTGYGELAPAMERYFADNLEQATAGDRQHRLVFYCLMDCWMSWNAARRAIALGYRQVAWYPDGTDGWADSDLPLQERLPVPRPDASE
jgi:PQQ-dependent catabolism-associated CXXCW motif protein